MQRTRIDWPGLTHTWNIITGCKRHCTYCYARRIHERFNKTPFSDIVFHPDRLNDKMPTKPSKIFIGSMSDIQFWERLHAMQILNVCALNPQHTFMFLSKYGSYHGFDWPANTMQGLTLTGEESTNVQHEKVTNMYHYRRPFLSIEPLLGELKLQIRDFEMVILGAMTGPGAVIPKEEWIQSIVDNVPEDKIWVKNNMRKYFYKGLNHE